MIKKRQLIILPLLLALSACHSGDKAREESNDTFKESNNAQTSPVGTPSESADSQGSDTTAISSSSVQFKQDNGKDLYKFLHSREGGKVEDADGNVLVSFFDNRDKGYKSVRVFDASSKESSVIRLPNSEQILIYDYRGGLLFKLNFKDDRHYKLKDAEGKTLYKVKEESYGLKIEEGEGEDGKALCKVKVKEGKVSLKDADGKTILYAKSDVPAQGLACFAMEKLSKEQQYGLAYALMFLRL